MNFFWGNVFEYFKDRRLGSIFFGTLGVILVILALAANFYKTLQENWRMVLAATGLLLLALIWREFRQMRARRLNRYKISPLARDEILKARSKLVKQK